MPATQTISTIYQHWFAAVEELNRTGVFLKFAQQTARAIEQLKDLPEYEIPVESMPRLQRAFHMVSFSLTLAAGNLDPSNPNIVSPKPFTDNVDRLLQGAAPFEEFRSSFETLLDVMIIKAESLEIAVPEKKRGGLTSYDDYHEAIIEAIRGSRLRSPKPGP